MHHNQGDNNITAHQISGVTKAMILAAGLGTRLKPWTDTAPKALAIVNGKTLLQRNIEYLQQYGIRDVVVNVHHFAEQVIAAVEKNKGWGSTITLSDETNAVLETGGGLLHAAPYLQNSEPFVVLNVDILTDMNLHAMIENHLQKKPLVTLATSNRKTSRYLLFDNNNQLCGWHNIKDGQQQTMPLSAAASLHQLQMRAFSGIHIIEPSIFNLIKQSGKFSIITAYLDLMHTNSIQSFEDSTSRFIDVGKPESVELAEAMFID